MQRLMTGLLAGAALLPGSAAMAADALKFGPAPAWVRPQAIPAAKAGAAPITLLLTDRQVAFEPGKVTTYNEGAIRIDNAQGLAAGNLSLVWQPATDSVTVNKLQIRRGDKVIDVLASGQTFTVLRRETNLDAATLDGTLTATMQPEGLQEGDIIVLATTTEHSDPVLKGHVETTFGEWDGVPIESAHADLVWPGSVHLDVRQTPNLPAAKRSSGKGFNQYEVSGASVQPLVPPDGAPPRFRIGRLGEASDFSSWSDLADLFIPLFRDAATIPATGPLHDEVDKIRAASADPKQRATMALALVQDRIRYVALLMGQGGYVPASAETTWSRRFGDCKAKTALLLGTLRSLGIEAEPVLVQSKLGDMIADRLPMIALFDHVLVRAHLGGKDYWLDGTRTGDTDLDAIEVPDFGWGLPLVEHAALVRMVPRALDRPSLEQVVDIDATAGAIAPAPITIDEIYRGDSAVALNLLYSAATPEQRDEALHDKAKSYFDSFTVGSSSFRFDKAKREFDISIKGSAALNWKDGWLNVPTSAIAFDPDFDRPAGPLHDAPMAITHPRFVKDKATIHLPAGFAQQQKLSVPVHETLAGTEYARTETIDHDVVTVESSERSIAPEVPYQEAVAAEPRLRALNKDDVYLHYPSGQRATDADVKAESSATPASASAYRDRGLSFLSRNDTDKAIADFTSALALDPTDLVSLANRAIAYVAKRDFAAADKDLAEVEKREPDNVLIARSRALEAEMKGDYAAAAELFTKSLEREPDDGFSIGHRALDYVATNQPDKALVDIDNALLKIPSWTELRIVRADLLLDKGRQEEAAAEADKIVGNSADYGRGLVAAARVYLRIGKKDRALAILGQAEALAKPDESQLVGEAQLLHDLGKADEAIKTTDQALKAGFKSVNLHMLRANLFMLGGKRDLVPGEADAVMRDNPTSDMAFVAAGKMLAAVGQGDKALKAFDRALAIKPFAYIYLNRSQVRPKSDVTDRLADLELALKLEPGNADVLAEKARVLAGSGDFSGALAALDQVKPGAVDSFAQVQRATVLAKAGRKDEAEKLFATLRAGAKTPTELNSLCWAKATEGIMLDSALDDCIAALKLTPGVGAYEDSLGMVMLKLGKLDEALDAYNLAVGKQTGAASLMGRALVYSRKGDRARAEADAAAARKMDAQIDDTFADYGLKFDKSAAASHAGTAK